MSKLLGLIKRHEGFRAAPYWDKTGQEIWQGLTTEVHKLRTSWAQKEFKEYCKDELGHLTIGYGFNLEAGMSKQIAHGNVILKLQHETLPAAFGYQWYGSLGVDNWNNLRSFDAVEKYCGDVSARQAVIISMIYQLGPTGFAGFKRMIGHLEKGNAGSAMMPHLMEGYWKEIANEMLDSKWAREDSPARARELAEIMRTGEWPQS